MEKAEKGMRKDEAYEELYHTQFRVLPSAFRLRNHSLCVTNSEPVGRPDPDCRYL